MKDNELQLLRLYQAYSKYKEYYLNEELISWKLSLIPDSLEGKTVLDVGAFEGFFSLVCEQRGAKQVVAIDNAQNHNEFCYKKILQIIPFNAEAQWLNLIYLDTLKQKFDFVLVLDVLSQLEDPVSALKAIKRSTNYEICFSDKLVSNNDNKAILEFVDSAKDDKIIWLANQSGLAKMMDMADFSPVETVFSGDGDRIGIRALAMQKVANPHVLDHRILHS